MPETRIIEVSQAVYDELAARAARRRTTISGLLTEQLGLPLTEQELAERQGRALAWLRDHPGFDPEQQPEAAEHAARLLARITRQEAEILARRQLDG